MTCPRDIHKAQDLDRRSRRNAYRTPKGQGHFFGQENVPHEFTSSRRKWQNSRRILTHRTESSWNSWSGADISSRTLMTNAPYDVQCRSFVLELLEGSRSIMRTANRLLDFLARIGGLPKSEWALRVSLGLCYQQPWQAINSISIGPVPR